MSNFYDKLLMPQVVAMLEEGLSKYMICKILKVSRDFVDGVTERYDAFYVGGVN